MMGQVMLLIEQLAPSKRFDITFAAPDFARSRRGSWFYAGARNDLPVVVIDPIEYEKPGYGDAITLVDVSLASFGERRNDDGLVKPHIDPGGAERVDRFVLQRSTRIVSFETGNMREPIEAMNICTQGLVAVLDLGEEAGDKHTPPLMPRERSYFQDLHHDFVSTPGNKGHEAVLRIRAIIAPDGSVEDCHHEYPLNTGGLLPDVCAIVSKMRFTPARSATGQAFRSVYAKVDLLIAFWSADGRGPWRKRWKLRVCALCRQSVRSLLRGLA